MLRPEVLYECVDVVFSESFYVEKNKIIFGAMLDLSLKNEPIDVLSLSTKLAEQTKGLLGHMLVFARQAVTTVAELSFKFIRWVFDVTLGALYRTAREAINSVM